MAGLLNPKNIKELDSILELHIVAGKVLAKDLKDGQRIPSLNGGAGGVLTVSISDQGTTRHRAFLESPPTFSFSCVRFSRRVCSSLAIS